MRGTNRLPLLAALVGMISEACRKSNIKSNVSNSDTKNRPIRGEEEQKAKYPLHLQGLYAIMNLAKEIQ